MKHFISAATQGHDYAIQNWHEDGFVSRDDLASALCAHQAAVDATKSPQRKAVEQAACVRLLRLNGMRILLSEQLTYVMNYYSSNLRAAI